MIGVLKKLLFGRNDAEEAVAAGAHADAALHHAAAGLLVEAALLDGDFSGEERQRIETLLRERFELGQSETAELMIAVEEAAADRVELHTITQAVRDHFSPEERVKMIEMLWDVVYADGDLDDFEANMMRAVTGLLYVSDRDSGDARKRVLARRSSST
ncbi:MAG: TerB family tellurite resistance protein [Pseudomonadota bacterium]|nr:TerB family tellurite resistance protein [Pseudomonadota bacterium]